MKMKLGWPPQKNISTTRTSDFFTADSSNGTADFAVGIMEMAQLLVEPQAKLAIQATSENQLRWG
jgi:hypothetical protein